MLFYFKDFHTCTEVDAMVYWTLMNSLSYFNNNQLLASLISFMQSFIFSLIIFWRRSQKRYHFICKYISLKCNESFCNITIIPLWYLERLKWFLWIASQYCICTVCVYVCTYTNTALTSYCQYCICMYIQYVHMYIQYTYTCVYTICICMYIYTHPYI